MPAVTRGASRPDGAEARRSRREVNRKVRARKAAPPTTAKRTASVPAVSRRPGEQAEGEGAQQESKPPVPAGNALGEIGLCGQGQQGAGRRRGQAHGREHGGGQEDAAQLVYGVGCGALTVLFRYFGLYPEGVTYAILLMNAGAWRWTRPCRRCASAL